MKTSTAFLLLAALATGCAAQDYGWAVGGASLFPIGWTEDGASFAYGTFEYSTEVRDRARLCVIVQNMKTDRAAWRHERDWDEGATGGRVPRTAAEAWAAEKGRIKTGLSQMKVRAGGAGSPMAFPLVGGDTLTVELTEQKSGDKAGSFHVEALSRDLGTKMICQAQKGDLEGTLEMMGYFPNPDGTRIAVIVRETGFSFPVHAYFVIGCSTKGGFVKSRQQ